MAPSDDLRDEIEAINAIYGNGTLVLLEGANADAGAAADADGAVTATLAVPTSEDDVAGGGDGSTRDDTSHRLCLRVRFPAGYPACADAPAVVGVQSVGDGAGDARARRPGAAALDAARFGAALEAVFARDVVCVYDAVEVYMRETAEAEAAEAVADAADAGMASGSGSEGESGSDGEDGDGDGDGDGDEDKASAKARRQQRQSQSRRRARSPPPSTLAEPPPWTVAEPVVELKSVFVARCAPVSSPAQARAYVDHLLATDRRVQKASHNMTAWRIRPAAAGSGSGHGAAAAHNAVVYQDCDDDGETAAGGRLLHLMQLMDLWNVMVLVTRWYGGHKLGPRRFALINQAARDAFVRADLVVPSKKKGK